MHTLHRHVERARARRPADGLPARGQGDGNAVLALADVNDITPAQPTNTAGGPQGTRTECGALEYV